MPFIIYRTSVSSEGIRYDFAKQIQVNDLAVVLIDYLRSEKNDTSDVLKWQIPEADILRRLNYDPDTHAFIIDIKPGVRKNVSLCRLKEMWGYSDKWWTPVLLRLETIFIDRKEESPEEFKHGFSDETADKSTIHEFLYLDAGTQYGRRRWGKTGYVNAAMLWDGALEYFYSIIKDYLKSIGKPL